MNKKIFSKLKYKKLIIASALFFLLINTMYFWEGKMGFLMMPIVFILIIYFCVLIWKVLKHSYYIYKEKFQNKQRNYAVLITVFVLIVTGLFPYGIIPYQKLEKNLLVVWSKGVANCTRTLYFRHNNIFIEKNICFGMHQYRGKFELKGDTIFPIAFQKNSIFEDYEFGVISDEKYLYLYRNANDSIPYPMRVRKNNN
jgi:hypothetical protein